MNSQTLNSYNQYAKDYFASIDHKIVHRYIEKPAMYRNLPVLDSKKVLCIGCGTGDECLEIYKRGATEIVAVDESYAMLEIAKSKFSYIPNIKFVHANFLEMEDNFELFDFVYSSLTLHYEPNISESLHKIGSFLPIGGNFLYSVNHPIHSAFQEINNERNHIRGIGTISNNQEKEIVFGDYFNNSLKQETWMQGKFKYNYYHFTFEQIFNAHKENNFEITKILEPLPIEDKPEDFPNKYTKSPNVLLISSIKK